MGHTILPSRLESLQFPPDFVQLSKRPSSASLYLQGILVERQFKGKQVMLMTNKELVGGQEIGFVEKNSNTD